MVQATHLDVLVGVLGGQQISSVAHVPVQRKTFRIGKSHMFPALSCLSRSIACLQLRRCNSLIALSQSSQQHEPSREMARKA